MKKVELYLDNKTKIRYNPIRCRGNYMWWL